MAARRASRKATKQPGAGSKEDAARARLVRAKSEALQADLDAELDENQHLGTLRHSIQISVEPVAR